MTRNVSDPRTAKVISFFETLSPQSLSQLHEVYAQDAHFKDPFNEVQGIAAIHRVFEHMFDTLKGPRFAVQQHMTQGDEAWLSWHFLIDRPEGSWTIRGATYLQYDPAGRIKQHRDYWDPAEELYARLPILGTLMRWLTRRLSASA